MAVIRKRRKLSLMTDLGLIVRTIYVKGPQLETQTATVAMQLWLFC